jgi:hypothetical protein
VYFCRSHWSKRSGARMTFFQSRHALRGISSLSSIDQRPIRNPDTKKGDGNNTELH